ncbi:AI-2E family transporter [Halioglobus pacificus]|uniref:AI-2E family transporter n=1 Tax=Parahalioglobus pacificus TaxID=930806 RepID=A0A918XI58_9GAMM|nr:AI-2E family transporter [Halioglobus pacificus]GHD32749.1 AI-2E family transporter [Halioglobus pacificus]
MAEITPPEPPLVINRWPLMLGVIVALGVLFYVLQPILLPFVLGAVIAYLGDPLVDALERRKVSRTVGVVLVFLLFSSIVFLLLLLAIPMLLQQLDAMVSKIPAIYRWITTEALPWIQARFSVEEAGLPRVDWSAQLADNWQSLGRLTANTFKQITGSGASLLLGIANMALVPVVAFYLMRDWDAIMSRMLMIFPRAWQDRVNHMVGEADEVVGAFIRGQLIVMCALGVIYSAGLWMVGVQLALLLGVIAGLASIVPYLGFAVGIVASLIAAWAQSGDWLMLLSVAVVFGVGQLIESMVLTPILVGDRIGLHPVAVIFALMAGGQLAGFVGVLVALPVAAVIMVFARHAVAYYRASELYGAD